MSGCKVSFPGTAHGPVALPVGSNLSEHLDVENSPVLFGCRTGICGTCAANVAGDIPPPAEDEQEVLEVYAPDEPAARLCCQLDLQSDIAVVMLPRDDA